MMRIIGHFGAWLSIPGSWFAAKLILRFAMRSPEAEAVALEAVDGSPILA